MKVDELAWRSDEALGFTSISIALPIQSLDRSTQLTY